MEKYMQLYHFPLIAKVSKKIDVINFEKAFDQVKHTKLFQCLKSYSIHYYDMRLLINLYYSQIAVVRLDDSVTNENTNKKRRKTRMCSVTPAVQPLFREHITRGFILQNRGSGEIINNVRYADDTATLRRTWRTYIYC